MNLLVGLGSRDLHRLGSRETLELLPVTGHLEDRPDRLGGLCADRQPVLHPLGVHLDDRGVRLRLVLPELLDRAAVPLGAGVGDDDAVMRRTDLAHALELYFDCHG